LKREFGVCQGNSGNEYLKCKTYNPTTGKSIFWQVTDENMDAFNKSKRSVDGSPKLFRQKHFTYREGYFFTAFNTYFEMQWGTGTGKLSSIKRILSTSLIPAK
jgi:hypothetical protein